MKSLIYFLFLLLPGVCRADTFILKDGAKIEGEITGEMEGAVLVKTKYGTLTISRTDIQEQQAAPAIAPALPEAVPAPAGAAVDVASATPAAVQPAPAEPTRVRLTFTTVQPSTSAHSLVYSADWVVIATETFNADGALVVTEGVIRDGTYMEYYDNGGLKTVKTFSGGKASGNFRAYYRSGKPQIEAYYLSGAKEGQFKYFAEDGKQLMEAEYKNDKLNGWKKEFDAEGAVKSTSYYTDDRLAEQPKPEQPAKEAAKAPESLVAVKVTSLARGERFTFQLNGKYIGKLSLDKDFNIISLQGKMPDGEVKVYTKDGKLQKEFVFEGKTLKELRVYEPGGPLQAEYTFKDDMAVKK